MKNNDMENAVLLNKKQQIFVNLITVTTYSTYIQHFKIQNKSRNYLQNNALNDKIDFLWKTV